MANPSSHTPTERLLEVLAKLASVTGRETLAHYLHMAAIVVAAAADDGAQMKALTAEVQAMVDARRDPTPDEWAALRARRKSLEAQIAAIPPGGEVAPPTVVSAPVTGTATGGTAPSSDDTPSS